MESGPTAVSLVTDGVDLVGAYRPDGITAGHLTVKPEPSRVVLDLREHRLRKRAA